MKRITIDPVTRIEGHAKITIQLDDDGKVADTQLSRDAGARLREVHRRPPVLRDAGNYLAHLRHLPDQPPAGVGQGLRRDHGGAHSARRRNCCARLCIAPRSCSRMPSASSIFPRPICCWAWMPTPPIRNVVGLIEANPELARAGIELRKFGLQVIEGLAEERVHPSWIVPGGVKSPMTAQLRDRILAAIPQALATTERTLSVFKATLDTFAEEIANFGIAPTMYAGLVDGAGNLQLYDGVLRFRGADGEIVQDGIAAEDYAEFIGEATLREFVSEGALLPAPGVSPGQLPRRPAGAHQRCRCDGNAAGRRRAAGIPPAVWPHGA